MDLIDSHLKINRHPWELSRAQCLEEIIKKHPDSFRYADIGAGDQFLTNKLSKYSKKEIYAVDCNYSSIKTSKRIIMVKDIGELEDESFDRIIIMDVLEHINNEQDLLKEVYNKMVNNGKLIITVPAFQFLFCSNDIFYKHYRRYHRKPLCNILRSIKLNINESFYFYTSLFILRFFQVLLSKFSSLFSIKAGIGNWKLKEHNIITFFLVLLLNIDFMVNRALSRIGVRLPGLSLCIICNKETELIQGVIK